jgi:hypothetical protein
MAFAKFAGRAYGIIRVVDRIRIAQVRACRPGECRPRAFDGERPAVTAERERIA